MSTVHSCAVADTTSSVIKTYGQSWQSYIHCRLATSLQRSSNSSYLSQPDLTSINLSVDTRRHRTIRTLLLKCVELERDREVRQCSNICPVLYKNNKKHLKNVGPIHHCEPPHDTHQMSLAVLSRAACASMSTTTPTTTTTTTTTTRDRRDRYGPIHVEWAQ